MQRYATVSGALCYATGGGGGPTLLMSVHPLVFAKQTQTKKDKTDKNYFLRLEGSWMLIIDMCLFKMICKSHRL